MSTSGMTIKGTDTGERLYGSGRPDMIHGNGGNDYLYGGADPAAPVNMKVTFTSEDAVAKSSVGMYQIGPDGKISNVQILFANASATGSGGSLTPGQSSVTVPVAPDAQVGFFMVPDAFSKGTGSNLTRTDGHYELRTENGQPGNVNAPGSLVLWFVPDNPKEKEVKIQSANGHNTYHTGASSGGKFGPNGDQTDHTRTTVDPKTGLVTIGFEDSWKGGDKDYNDVVLTVDTMASPVKVSDPDIAGIKSAPISDDDTLYGGDGNDRIYGQSGNDLAYGDAGNDSVYGGDGDDQLWGGDGYDLVQAGNGNDRLYGGDWYDTMYGGTGNDALYGGLHSDKLWGDTGADKVYGESGADTLYGGEDNDQVYGGANNDLIYGGQGIDSVYGDDGKDTIYGDSGNDLFFGGKGDDTVNGGDGDDRVDGMSGNDSVYGGKGQDEVYGGDGNDKIYADSGNDMVYGGGSEDVAYGGTDNDILHGEGGFDSLYGGDGIDAVFGDEGNDFLFGGAGNDNLDGGTGTDVLTGGLGSDIMTGGTGWDTFVFENADRKSVQVDNITDFDVKGDTIDLRSLDMLKGGLTEEVFRDKNMTQDTDGSVLIRIDSLTIDVAGNTPLSVDAVWDQIIFV